MMQRWVRVLVWFAFAGLVSGMSVAKTSSEATAAMKQVSKAIKGVRAIVAQVEYTETVDRRTVTGTGTLSISFDGLARVDIGGHEPRTVLYFPPYLYLHRKTEEIVEVYNVALNPNRLAQYVLLGFVPAGTDMKKDYKVGLVDNASLDDKPVLNFLLTPKSKAAAKTIARIMLWVDPETGLPRQQQIIHAVGGTELFVRYLSISEEEALPDTLFHATWPEGTTKVRK
jgi:outer membrane lipoprotein-sorting protein